jgi:hypothetical protein
VLVSSLLFAGDRAVGISSEKAPKRFAIVAVLLLGIQSNSAAAAELIIDDFDVQFQAPLPDSVNQGYVVQHRVGALTADRTWYISASSSSPTGQIDSDISRSSSLNIQIDRFHTTPGSAASVDLGIDYSFVPTDITAGGVNDRIVLDFAFLQSAAPLARVYLFINGRGVGHGGALLNIPTSSTPFSIEFPFDATKFDAAHASDVLVNISPAYFSGPDQINFSAAIDRIRITSAVPEPDGLLLVAAGTVGLLCLQHSRRVVACG